MRKLLISMVANFLFWYNQANFLFGYEVITMIIVLVTTKEKSLGTNFNQQNWMLVIRLESFLVFFFVNLPNFDHTAVTIDSV